jgi:CheY-like chemotaxis protein
MEKQHYTKGAILIIDDDPDIRTLMQKVLEKEGYLVDTAKHKEEALEKIARSQPLLILLDVLLSGADGRELCQYIKSNSSTANIPVIIFSAHPSINDDKVKTYGAEDFIAKPLNTELLLQKVEKHFAAHTK